MSCVFCNTKMGNFSYIENFSQVDDTPNPTIDLDQKIDELENKISNLELEIQNYNIQTIQNRINQLSDQEVLVNELDNKLQNVSVNTDGELEVNSNIKLTNGKILKLGNRDAFGSSSDGNKILISPSRTYSGLATIDSLVGTNNLKWLD